MELKNLFKLSIFIPTLMLIFTNNVFAEGFLEKTIGGLEQERLKANEDTACATLKTIASAFEVYRSMNQKYPKTINELLNTKPPLIPSYMGDGKSSMGYKHEVIVSGDNNYLIVASPDSSMPAKFTGRYSFCIMEDGKIRRAKKDISITDYEIAQSLELLE